MKKNIIMSVTMFATSLAVYAEETKNYNGYINYNLRHLSGEETAAKATEYYGRDFAFGDLGVAYSNDKYSTFFMAQDVATDSQEISLNGRQFNLFKFNVKYSELNHMLSNDAKSMRNGVGTRNLTGSAYASQAAARTAESSWTTFDYGVQKHTLSADAKANIGNNFFTSFAVDRQTNDGVRPSGYTSAGNRKVMEIAEPVSNQTINTTVAFGFKGENDTVTLKGVLSKFTPEYDEYTVADQVSATKIDHMTTSPESNYYKIGVDGVHRELPLHSTFVYDLHTSKTWNDLAIRNVVYGTTADAIIALSSPTFSGDIKTYHGKLVLKSHPIDALNAKLYLKYFDKNNDSTALTQTNGTASVLNDRFAYSKKNGGVAVDYQLPLSTRVDLSGDYTSTMRTERLDFDETKDVTGTLAVQNKSFDMVTPKVQYTYLNREANFLYDHYTSDAERAKTLMRRFDLNSKDMHDAKGSVAVVALDSEDYGTADVELSGGKKINEYKHVYYGRINDSKFYYAVDANYTLPDRVAFTVFGEVEVTQEKTSSRQFVTGSGVPGDLNNATNFDWVGVQKDKLFTFGAKADVVVLADKLNAKIGYTRQESDGGVDYDVKEGSATPADSVVHRFDDYQHTTLDLEMDYRLSSTISFAAGYSREIFKYSDLRSDSYQRVFTTTNQNILTGAYMDREYSTNEFWGGATYKF